MNPDPVKAVEDSYEANVSDEFVKPVVVCPEGVVNEGDSVIFMNFRPDRAREMTGRSPCRSLTALRAKMRVSAELCLHRAV